MRAAGDAAMKGSSPGTDGHERAEDTAATAVAGISRRAGSGCQGSRQTTSCRSQDRNGRACAPNPAASRHSPPAGRTSVERQKLRGGNVERLGQTANVEERNVALTPFDGPDIASCDATLQRQLLLRPPLASPQSCKAPTEEHPWITSHPEDATVVSLIERRSMSDNRPTRC